MPSPAHRPRPAGTSPGQRDSKGAALRRGDLKISDPMQRPQDFSHGISQHFTMPPPGNPTTTSNMPLEGTWPGKSVSPDFHSRTRSTGTNKPQRSCRPSSNTTSRSSAGPSILNGYPASGPSQGALNTQKDNRFRSKIRRMFGSRRLRDMPHSSETGGSHSQSDPPHLISEETPKNREPTPTRSQPIGELTRSSALGSHSPKPLPPLEASQQELTTSNETAGPASRHRRRNTLPSVTLSFHEAQMLAATLGEMGMRPSSNPPLHHVDPESTRSRRRRSRSADELRDEERSHQMSPIQWRRRSGEIQYWRNSVLEKPLPDPRGPPHDTHHGLESERALSRGFAPLPGSASQPAVRESLNQFHFGSFANAAAAAHRTTMEQRLTTLEIKSVDHEYAIAELQGRGVTRPVTATKAPKRRPVQDIFPDTNDPASPARPVLSSPADSPTLADEASYSARYYRSSNAPTLRPAADNLPSPNLITTEQHETLKAFLAAEQAARHKLEETVAELQAQIDDLRRASYQPRRPSAYPTPSPESRHSTLAFRGQSTRRPLGFHRSRVGSDETSRFSVTDADDSGTEDGFLDTFETPRETQEGRFGHESNRGSPAVALV